MTAAGLVFVTGADGKGALQLWPMFGAVNQLLAALALLVVTVYLKRRGGLGYLVTALPCLFMLLMTVWAMVAKEVEFLTAPAAKYAAVRRVFLVGFNSAVLLLAGWVAVESGGAFFRPGAGGGGDAGPGAAPPPAPAAGAPGAS